MQAEASSVNIWVPDGFILSLGSGDCGLESADAGLGYYSIWRMFGYDNPFLLRDASYLGPVITLPGELAAGVQSRGFRTQFKQALCWLRVGLLVNRILWC